MLLLLPVAVLGFGMLGISVFVVVLVPYLAVLVYISMVWQLASVVSVLEDDYGIKAMKKSKALLKGKTGVAVAMFLVLVVCFIGIQVVFEIGVLFYWSMSVEMRIGIPILCFLMLFMVVLFGLVAQTVIYFVCKSYHHENIDKSCLADHLEVYLGEYVPLKAKDVQLEQFHV
ncbi:hypothetical protein ES288_D04G038700v1 [Gossypium darwinii]|uniref:Uncharacterized protein n=1 Tax=Gossypium darwinii TaxID=34276 RepID=A0A5D2CSV9_GOSDA|nr:hypothetical protein ES288_D04G038700v1 [Gossypium darwinii]